jgi:HEPN domain-containing protein
MGAIGIGLAEDHLAAARILLGAGRIDQAAGIAHQAVDAAFACLIEKVNGSDLMGLRQRWLRADRLGICTEDVSRRLWRARNIGFYANVRAGDGRVTLDIDEARWAVRTAEGIVRRVRAMLDKRR